MIPFIKNLTPAYFQKWFQKMIQEVQEPANFQTGLILSGLSLFWLGMVLIVDPRGEFPLNDDWMYARTVFALVNEKKYVLCDFQAAIAFAQVLWGALFSTIFGFSMTILRVSVLVLGWFGILTSYFVFRKSGQGSLVSATAAALLASTPFYFIIANTFMTNVPFYACLLGSVYFLIRWIEGEKLPDIVLGIMFACLAMLVRQLAMLIPVAFTLACVTYRGFSKKTIWACLACCLAVPGTLFFYHEWLRHTIGVPFMDASKASIIKTTFHLAQQGYLKKFIAAFIIRLIAAFIYLGIFLLPLLVLIVPTSWRSMTLRRKLFNVLVFVLFFLMSVMMMILIKQIMPIMGIYIFNFGVGPRTILGAEYLYTAPPLFWLGVSLIGALSGAALVAMISDVIAHFIKDLIQGKDTKKYWLSVFCLSACFIHFVPFGLTGHFDLYLALYIPFLILFLLARTPVLHFRFARYSFFLTWLLVLCSAAFSVAGAHDYLSWNGARWAGLRYVMQTEKVSPAEIDGGYEFNGWFLYDPKYTKIPGRSWWWVNDDKYIASFGLKDGYMPLHVIPYRLWLPPWKGRVIILKRIKDQVARDFSQAKNVYTM